MERLRRKTKKDRGRKRRKTKTILHKRTEENCRLGEENKEKKNVLFEGIEGVNEDKVRGKENCRKKTTVEKTVKEK